MTQSVSSPEMQALAQNILLLARELNQRDAQKFNPLLKSQGGIVLKGAAEKILSAASTTDVEQALSAISEKLRDFGKAPCPQQLVESVDSLKRIDVSVANIDRTCHRIINERGVVHSEQSLKEISSIASDARMITSWLRKKIGAVRDVEEWKPGRF